MVRGLCHIRQHDCDVIYKAARKAGYSKVEIVVGIDGTLTSTASDGRAVTTDDDKNDKNDKNEWDNI